MNLASRIKTVVGGFILTMILGTAVSRADTWTTTEGDVYQNVKVVSHDAGFVTIMDSDGGATIPLRVLPAALQAKFHYDAVKAAAAEKAAAAQDAADQQAVAASQQQQGVAAQQQQAGQATPLPPATAAPAAPPVDHAALVAARQKAAQAEAIKKQIANNESTIEEDKEQLEGLQSTLTDEKEQIADENGHGGKPSTGLADAQTDTQNKVAALQKEISKLEAENKQLASGTPAP